ncbi:hypothetical protein D3C77_564820 [compost metagenome]
MRAVKHHRLEPGLHRLHGLFKAAAVIQVDAHRHRDIVHKRIDHRLHGLQTHHANHFLPHLDHDRGLLLFGCQQNGANGFGVVCAERADGIAVFPCMLDHGVTR